MIRFFRINDPMRLVAVLLLVLAIRLPLLLAGVELTQAEIHWQLIGEALSEGKRLYSGVWDDLGPIASSIYWGIFLLFGKQQWPLQVLSIVSVILQAGIFNHVMMRSGAYNEKSYVPAFFYGLFMCLSFDLFTLPPVMMAMPLLLLALNHVVLINKQQMEQDVFNVGLYVGAACLIFPASIWFFAAMLFALFSFRISSVRMLLLALHGFFLSFAFLLVALYFQEGTDGFVEQYVLSFARPKVFYSEWKELIALMALPAALLLVSVLRVFGDRAYINFQISIQQIMLVWAAAGVLALFNMEIIATYQIAMFVPPLAFFATHYALVFKKQTHLEMGMLVFTLLLVANCYLGYYGLIPDYPLHYKQLKAQQAPASLKGRRILVMGNDYSFYRHSQLASPFLNWELTKRHFGSLDDYRSISEFTVLLERDLPEAIVDQEGMLKSFLARVPHLSARYEEREPGVYMLK